jgi:redox-sensitive bicupin YhaK (pirin superfamily)
MKKTIHRSDSRGYANHGWLEARHSFSFAGYHDPSRVHFGMLRVLNDDIVAPARGFGMHPHDNMEIVTIPIAGALQHGDNKGNKGIIRAGDVQIMSAGTGIVHSEANPSQDEEVNLLQIWVFPKKENITPRYDQKTFDAAARKNRFQTLVSPNEEEGALWINQDAWFSMTETTDALTLSYSTHVKGNGMYIFVMEGGFVVDGEEIDRRDAIGISETEKVELILKPNSKVLIIEVPMN